MNDSISTGFLRTSLRRSASLRSGLATIAWSCALESAVGASRLAVILVTMQPVPRAAAVATESARRTVRMGYSAPGRLECAPRRSTPQARLELGDAIEQVER